MKVSCRVPPVVFQALGLGGRLLVWMGLVLVGIYVWSESDRWMYQRAQEAYLNLPPAPEAAPIPAPAATATPMVAAPRLMEPDRGALGRLEIPRLKMNVIVSEGIDSRTLRRSAGHVPGTALPGSGGNSVIAAHRDGLFRGLRSVERGDLIRFRSPESTTSYIVDALSIVGPNDTAALRQDGSSKLTLITCFPFDYIGPSPRRFVVTATRADGR